MPEFMLLISIFRVFWFAVVNLECMVKLISEWVVQLL